jgi:hypothetical protein
MAKVILNPAIQQIRGSIGGMVFRRGASGEIHLMKTPNMSKVKWSKKQKEHRQRMKLAVAYAHAVKADEKIYAIYLKEAGKKGKRPFNLAVSDYFKDRNLLNVGK